MTVYAWRRIVETPGHSMASLRRAGEGWIADGVEVLAGPEPIACDFSVELSSEWVTRRVVVESVDSSGRRRVEASAVDGRWTVDGVTRPDLDGVTDVDVAATPLTNTFPIRRLAALAVGASETLAVAWVDVPSLVVSCVEQTYRRLGDREWGYSDPVHGAFRLTVDADGVVEVYEGFAERVGSAATLSPREKMTE